MPRETVIIQFKSDCSPAEFDWLIGIEEALIQAFAQNGKAEVDGHDCGNGTMNIFLFPLAGWTAAIEIALAHLKRHDALSRAVIIKRSKKEKYSVVWPESFSGDFVRP